MICTISGLLIMIGDRANKLQPRALITPFVYLVLKFLLFLSPFLLCSSTYRISACQLTFFFFDLSSKAQIEVLHSICWHSDKPFYCVVETPEV